MSVYVYDCLLSFRRRREKYPRSFRWLKCRDQMFLKDRLNAYSRNEFSGIPSRKRLRDFESVTIDIFAPGQRELTFWTSPSLRGRRTKGKEGGS